MGSVQRYVVKYHYPEKYVRRDWALQNRAEEKSEIPSNFKQESRKCEE